MTLKERIESDLKTALLNRDRLTVDTLRGLKAVILNEEVSKGKRSEGLDDETVEQLIARETKKRSESAEIYEKSGRPELAESETKEIAILKQYLPEPMGEEELTEIINQYIKSAGISDPGMVGQLIGLVKKQVGSRADGAQIARLASEILK